MNLTSQDRETSSEAASGSEESDSRASQELRQQMSYLRWKHTGRGKYIYCNRQTQELSIQVMIIKTVSFIMSFQLKATEVVHSCRLHSLTNILVSDWSSEH